MALVTPVGSQAVAGLTAAVEAADHAESIVNAVRSGFGKARAYKKTAVTAYQRYRNRNRPRARTPTRKYYRTRRTGNLSSYQSDRAYNLKVERAYEMAYRKGYLKRPSKRRKKGSSLTTTAVRDIARKEIRKTEEIHRNPYFRSTDGKSGNETQDTATPPNTLIHCGEPMVYWLANSIDRGTTHFARCGSALRYLGFNFRVFVENKNEAAKLGVRVMLLKFKFPDTDVKTQIWEDNDNDANEKADAMEGGNVTATDTHLNDVFQLYRPVNKKRFDVVQNDVFFCDRALPDGGKTGPRVSNRFFRKYYKINKTITYDDNKPQEVYKLVMLYQYVTSDATDSTIVPRIEIGQFDEYFIP